MPTTDHELVHEELTTDECLRLLVSTAVGRLAYTQDALPAIRPVSFAVCGSEVQIPALPGSPFLDAVRGAVVALEADDFDPAARTGWTVVVVGHSRVLVPSAVE